MDNTNNNYQGIEIAIIGMAGKFPHANSINKLWGNLSKGKECITFFTKEDLINNGIGQTQINNSNYIKAKAQLEEVDMFDASFFGYSPKEAELIDPQQRLFLECTHEALENAGYNHELYNGLIGVFAGEGFSNYYLNNIIGNDQYQSSHSAFQTTINNYNDFLCTRVSYKLNLKGPSITIQTACSTSLVAVHKACQSLLLRECDIALAGGSKVIVPRNTGYTYSEGGITSQDGHCRAFDKDSSGMIPGEGVGVVVLKRLEDALSEGDYIHAVIRGSAINNDGSNKIGFTAPSIDGQVNVIKEAQSIADVEPETISYIETHGTGTKLGDPIEVKALTEAFNTSKKQYCAIGSVKTNLGHLDSAAGITGLLKAVLMLKNKKLVPSLHFKSPNPNIDFSNSPFYVNTDFREWTADYPRRAGVSSFGIGGTNAHMILEEAPKTISSAPSREYKILQLSAKTKNALEKANKNLIEYLEENQDKNLNDIAYTLQVGRKSHQYRKMIVAEDIENALTDLKAFSDINTNQYMGEKTNIIFMFSGQGSQYTGMAKELYISEPYFRKKVEACQKILSNHSKINVINFLNDKKEKEDTSDKINQTYITQPLLFIIEYSMAKLLMHWGIKPDSMIGHSIGEYVAACLSGVISLEDAIKIVVKRGLLMQSVPQGKMLSVALNEEKISKLIDRKIDIAAINTTDSCIISGETVVIDNLKLELEQKGVFCIELSTSHAFHSFMMDPILADFEKEFENVTLQPPQTPFISNFSGTWISNEEATSPSYWSLHLRHTVRFEKGISNLLKEDGTVFIECGPGKSLCSFVKHHPERKSQHKTINMFRHQRNNTPDSKLLMSQLGQLWLNGIDIDWTAFYENEKRQRLPLPTYPFERQKYWINQGLNKKSNISYQNIEIDEKNIFDWFHAPIWEQSLNSVINPQFKSQENWLVFSSENELSSNILNILRKNKQKFAVVKIGDKYKRESDNEYFINPTDEDSYNQLATELNLKNNTELKILHLWNASENYKEGLNFCKDEINYFQDIGLFSLLNTAKAIGKTDFNPKVEIYTITNGLHSVTGMEKSNPLNSTILGATKVIPLEFNNFYCYNIDIQDNPENYVKISHQILTEITGQEDVCKIIAYRGNYRWKLKYKNLKLRKSEKDTAFRNNGVYIITGGLGGMGLTFAEYLAKNYDANIVLIGRKELPKELKPTLSLQEEKDKNNLSYKLAKLWELNNSRGQVEYFSADISDINKLNHIIDQTEKKYGQINGVLHTAGLADFEGIISNRNKEQTYKILTPKVEGTLALHSIFRSKELDFFICFSSLANQKYNVNFGQVGYAAANEFLDSYTYCTKKQYVKTINWNGWMHVGMAAKALKNKIANNGHDSDKLYEKSLTPQEGIEVLKLIIQNNYKHIVVSKSNFFDKNDEKHALSQPEVSTTKDLEEKKESLNSRPNLKTGYIVANTETERNLVEIYKQFFGYNEIGINDNFYELGGDSLKALSLISTIKNKLKVELSLVEFLKHQDIESISKDISKKAKLQEMSINTESNILRF